MADEHPTVRRRRAVLAGHRGDLPTVRALLDDEDPQVRATALSALRRCGALTDDAVAAGLGDPATSVRLRAAELSAAHPAVSLLPSLADVDPFVVEMACWSAGERHLDPELGAVLVALVGLAGGHREPLVREAAVAAIGSLAATVPLPIVAADAARSVVLAAMSDRPHVRRRAVLALVAFDGPDIDAALTQATTDRDWQVRDAARELAADP
ncbi:MAG: hypothetical protein ACKV2O_12830 [Acidimicrobiales bacterium]